MRKPTLEKRLSDLEFHVSELDRLVSRSPHAKDWRRSIGAFTDDRRMQAVFAEAMRIRAADRARVRRGSRVKANGA
jgi:hypothetical protein